MSAHDPAPRSWLFAPADSPRKLERAFQTAADAVIVDLEDAVALPQKDAARRQAAAFLAALPPRAASPAAPLRYVRINALDTPFWHDDLDAAISVRADGIVLPKPRSGEDVHKLSIALRHHEARVHIDGTPTRILAIATETPASLLAMHTYAEASTRLIGLAWGAEDLSAAIGARDSRDGHGALTSPFRLARDLTLFAAAHANVGAVDAVHLDTRDLTGLSREARAAAYDGFAGKLAIHPDQIAVINEAFTPTPGEIAAAEAIVAAFAAAPDSGVVALDGRMVDRPHLLRAERTLARARRGRA